MTIDTRSLPADVSAYIQAEFGTGKYQSIEDVVVIAVREMRDREKNLSELRDKIDVGLEDFARGDFIEIADQAAHDALFNELKAEVLKGSTAASAKS